MEVGPYFLKKNMKHIENPFWKDVFAALHDFTVNVYNDNENIVDILFQPLWFNININKKSILELENLFYITF